MGDSSIDRVCKSLSKYGDAFENSCRYCAEQCIEQSDHSWDHCQVPKVEKGDVSGCISSMPAAIQLFGPISPRHLPSSLRPQSPLTYFSEMKRRIASLADPGVTDSKMLESARRILMDRGLLNDGDDVEKAIKGRVVAAHSSNSGRSEFFLILLDMHDSAEVQTQIHEVAKKLHSRGLTLVAAEGLQVGKYIIPLERVSKGDCMEMSKFAYQKIACDLSPAMYVFGAEELIIYHKSIDLLKEMSEALIEKPNMEGACTALRATEDFFRATWDRSAMMIVETMNTMKQRGDPMAALIAGGYHLGDFKPILDAMDFNYIAVAVPAFDKAVSRNEKRHDKRWRRVEKIFAKHADGSYSDILNRCFPYVK